MIGTNRFALYLLAATLVGAGMLPMLSRSGAAQEPTATAGVTISTRARVIHAATNEGDIQVSFEGERVIDELGYGEVSDFVDIPTGEVWVQINEAGRDITDYIYSATYPVVPAGNDYQIVFSDNLIQAQLVDTTPLGDGKARVRLVHTSSSTPTFDVLVDGRNLPLVSGIKYPFATGYAEVPAGSHDLQFVQTGTKTVLLSLPGTSFEAGKVYDLVLAGKLGDDEHPLKVITGVADTTT
jgi:hypothetical protein